MGPHRDFSLLTTQLHLNSLCQFPQVPLELCVPKASSLSHLQGWLRLCSLLGAQHAAATVRYLLTLC
jgi:hypothetical protein